MLAFELAKRSILDRYLNQSIGAVWAVITPLILMLTYVVLFTTVFSNRVPGDPSGPWSGVVYILSAMAQWLVISDVMSRSSMGIQSNISLLRQNRVQAVVIPLKETLAALFPFAISLVVIIAIVAATRPSVVLGMAILLPIALVIQFGILFGLSMLLSAIGAFSRDLKDFVSVFTTVGLFIAPVLYFPSLLERNRVLNDVIHANPFSYPAWIFRDALFYGRPTYPLAWVISAVFALVLLGIGYALFARLSRRFVEVV